MALPIISGTGSPETLKTTPDGSDHVPHNHVDSLPTSFLTDTGAIKTAVQALAAIISGSRLAVDLSSTVVTYLANLTGIASSLTTLSGAITTARMAVNVDSTTLAKLDALIALLGPATPVIEQITAIPAVGGTASQFSSATVTKGIYIRNCSTGGQLLYLTKAATTPTATNGIILAPGEWTPERLECTNPNAWKMLCSGPNGAACCVGS